MQARSVGGGGSGGGVNFIINGKFNVNQANYVSGAAVPADKYGHDMWKMGSVGDAYTFSTVGGVTTATIPSGKVLQQIIEGVNLESDTYVLRWAGTAQGKIGAGSYGTSGITYSVTGGSNLTIEFGPGTVSKVEFMVVGDISRKRMYPEELILCQRHYEKSGINPIYALKRGSTDANPHAYVWFKQIKRAIPAVLISWTTGTGQTTIVGMDGFAGVAAADDFEGIAAWTASARL